MCSSIFPIDVTLLADTIYSATTFTKYLSFMNRARQSLINPLIIFISVVVFGSEVSVKDIILTILGVTVNMCAIFLLNADKEFQEREDRQMNHEGKHYVESKSHRGSLTQDHPDTSGSSQKLTPLNATCSRPGFPTVVFRDGQKSVSCLSLISGNLRNAVNSNLEAVDNISNRTLIKCIYKNKFLVILLFGFYRFGIMVMN